MLKRLFFLMYLLTVLALTAAAQDGEYRTAVHDQAAARKLVGKHKISLQWISWDYFGSAFVKKKHCQSGTEVSLPITGQCYWLKGEQIGRTNTDRLTIDGMIMSVDAKQFTFHGTIETKISHINSAKPCIRSGNFTFKITGKRKYWRLMEMDNPCDEATDYIDLYFR
jgi:hypothetical protein